MEAVFQAVLTAATQDGDMAAAKLLIDRIIPSRRGAPVSFHIRPLKTPKDCALAYADLLDDVGAGRLTPEEGQTISSIVAKRAELFASVELATEIEALKSQLAAVVGTQPDAAPPLSPGAKEDAMTLTRRSFNHALLATAAIGVAPAFAQALKSLKITAPAGPGGGYDQLARSTQEVLVGEKLAASVQVVNVPGAGGTVGLAGFANAKERDPALLVAGLGLVGATFINKAPVGLDQVTPLARLQGEYQPLFVAANSPIKTVNDLVAKFKENPGSVSWGGFAPGSPDHLLSGLVVKAAGGDVKKMNYVPVGTGGEMLPLVISGKVTVATGGLNEVAGQLKTGRLREGAMIRNARAVWRGIGAVWRGTGGGVRSRLLLRKVGSSATKASSLDIEVA